MTSSLTEMLFIIQVGYMLVLRVSTLRIKFKYKMNTRKIFTIQYRYKVLLRIFIGNCERSVCGFPGMQDKIWNIVRLMASNLQCEELILLRQILVVTKLSKSETTNKKCSQI